MSEQPKSVSTRSKFHIPNSTLFAMGYVDLIFTLKLTNKDLLKPEGEQNQSEENQKSDDRYYHIEDFNTIEDLKFLEDKQELWDKITVSGGNDTLKQLLVGNKISKKKVKLNISVLTVLYLVETQNFLQIYLNTFVSKIIYILTKLL